MPHPNRVTRRDLLRQAGVASGAALLLHLTGAATAQAHPGPAGGDDPDALFAAGRFDEADRGYRRRLADDPSDHHALAQLGYIALLSDRLPQARRLLTRALHADPGDPELAWRLADTYVRRDHLAPAVPLLREAGREPIAEQYDAFRGRPYRVGGAKTARLPFRVLDPLPVVEISVNGSSPEPFYLDTGASFGMSEEMAHRAGVEQVAVDEGRGPGGAVRLHYGIVRSLDLGGVTVDNVPVTWVEDQVIPPLPDGTRPGGAIGTTIFYRLLATIDFARQELVLRRKTPAQLASFRAKAAAGAATTPFWMAPTHFLFARGALNGHEMLCTVDSGFAGSGVTTDEQTALRVGIELDYDNPSPSPGAPRYPFVAEQTALGGVTRHDLPGLATAGDTPGRGQGHGFAAPATVTHEFFKPFAVTFDFATMTLYLTRRG